MMGHKDWDDGRQIYDIKFYANGVEYDLDVDANTGRICGFDMEYMMGYQPSVNTQPSANAQPSTDTKPSENTQSSANTQPSVNPQPVNPYGYYDWDDMYDRDWDDMYDHDLDDMFDWFD